MPSIWRSSLNFVFETGFHQPPVHGGWRPMADRAHHHLFEKTVASIQTDEGPAHAQIGHPVLRTAARETARARRGSVPSSTRCGGDAGGLFPGAERKPPWSTSPRSSGAGPRSFKEFMTEWVDRAVHEEPGRVSTLEKALVLGTCSPKRLGLRAPQSPARACTPTGPRLWFDRRDA